MSLKDDDVRAWLAAAAVPLAGDDPELSLDDLAPLEPMLRDATIVGLGESTHGTREFFRMRHRMVRFLVEELDFDTIALEASHAAVGRLNAYVGGADGDPHAFVGEFHLMWNIDEFLETVEWVRVHNTTSERTVRFYGLDIFGTRTGRELLTPYLRRAVPDRWEAVERIFRDLESAESGGWLTAHNFAHLEAFDELSTLLGEIDGDEEEPAEARRQLRVIQQWVSVLILQWVHVRLGDALPPLVPKLTPFGVLARTRYLADNIVSLLEREPEAKIAIWAHNLHVAKRYEDPQFAPMLTMGHYLEQWYGRAYYSLGLELASGRFLAREWSSEREAFGSLVTPDVPPPPEGSLPDWLASVPHDQYFLDLRNPAASASVSGWLDSPIQMHSMGAAYMNPPLLYTQMTLRPGFDGLIFVRDTSPTTATPRALVVAGGASGT